MVYVSDQVSENGKDCEAKKNVIVDVGNLEG